METVITEGNNIIEKFIGIKYDSNKNLFVISDSEWNNGYDDALLHLDRIANSFDNTEDNHILYFNSNFDLLMSVCKKWDVFYKEPLIYSNYSEYMRLCDELDDSTSCYDLNKLWEQLVENIKWYNSL